MHRHVRYFLQGLVLVAPVAVTVYLVIWAVDRLPLHGFSIPIAVALIYLVGLLTDLWLFRTITRAVESLLERIPLLKIIYTSVRDMMQFVVGDRDRQPSRPVVYHVPGTDMKMMGFVTCPTAPGILKSGNEGMACVYFPMSYALGGFTLLVPADKLEPVPADSASMMRLVVTGGVSGCEVPQPAEAKAPDAR